MPLVDLAQLQPDIDTPFTALPPMQGEAQPGVRPAGESVGPEDFFDVVTAAFRQDNSIGSLLTTPSDRVNAGTGMFPNTYNPWDDIRGTRYEAYSDAFLNSRNPAYTAALKAKIDQEEEDRRTLASAGIGGVLASMAAGIVDPTILIPVGGQVRAAAGGGFSVSRSALSAARAGLYGATASEAILQATQESRPLADSAVTIGTSTMLSALLGAGAARFLTRAEEKAAGEALARIIQDDGVSAARVADITTDDLSVAGGAASQLAEKTRFLSPNLRANFRASGRARLVSQTLAENTLYQAMHEQGRSLGPAVETLARSVRNARMLQASQAHNDLFSQMRKAGLSMSREEFEVAVGQALRRGDVGSNDFVSQAAQSWRRQVLDPFKEEAIDAGLLPPDVSVTTAASYFSRVWNRERLAAFEPDFKQRVAAFYENVIRSDYESSLEALAKRKARIEREIADLQLSPEDRAAALRDMEAAGDKLDADNVDQVERVSRIAELREEAKVARQRGDAAAAKAARAEVERIQAEGGFGLQNYIAERRKLRGRYKRVDLGYAGLSSRADKILSSLADLEERNLRSLQRLVQKGRKFERDMVKLSPRALADRLAEFRQQFEKLIEQSRGAVDRAGKALYDNAGKAAKEGGIEAAEKFDAATRKKIEAEAQRQQEHAERMTSIAERIRSAEDFDPAMSIVELKRAVDDLVMETSELTLARGGRAERLKERLARLDPKRLDERIAALKDTLRRLDGQHNSRWATKMDATTATPSFAEAARDVADDVFDKITGRDFGNNGSTFPEYMTPLSRGPMKDRTFNVPDELIEDFLESNVLTVGEHYSRIMAADIELARRYGRADMRDQILEIRQEYGDLRRGVAEAATDADAKALVESQIGRKLGAKNKEALLRFLRDDEKGAIHDIEAMRDLLRGTYKATELASAYGRTVRGVMAFNYIRNMGGALIANFTEMYRPAMVHGLRAFMGEGVAPLLTNLKAVKMSVKEAQLAGQVTETVLQNRLMALGEIGDPYRQGTQVERWLQNGSRVASRWNGLVYWTDAMKSISSVLSQNRILEGALKGKDKRLLAYLGIDESMSKRVAEQFAEHGEVLDSVHVANTQDWTDAEAVRAFRAAVSKDVDSIIVTKSVGDVPLFANTPTGKMLLQFRNYAMAAHSRVTLRGLQEAPHRFATGLAAMTTLGMLAATLRAWRGGEDRWNRFREAASNPGYLIGEGLDASGILALPMEIGNTLEKTTPTALGFSFNPVKSPLLAAGRLVNNDASMQGSSLRFSDRGVLSAWLGPTAGGFEDMWRSVGAAAAPAQGKEPTKKQIRAAQSMIPFGSYLGMREVLQVLTGDSPYLSDGEPAN